ncbi:hypothetical protein [Nocardia aurantiaca]|uniref:Class I SAM-dependent methyltransferase n=1 Tax=Nocardia aurantiaca TaxID=2675850 RepID=A0A6I3L211_9NOCA|nr:hypothetical protein [Nocardia aurantiaca]MTE17043.1 hypothetical protein [Nocardia aurantiaca]
MTPNSSRATTSSSVSGVAVPSTLWATGPAPFGPADRWPDPVVTRVVREFSAPGDRVLLLDPAPSTGRGGLRAVPADTGAALAITEAAGRDARLGPGPDNEHAALVLASLLGEGLGPDPDHVTALAARRVAAGGLLVVLSRCRHGVHGVLLDPAATVVADAQAADLLYLQHIIAAPVTGTDIASTAAPSSTQRPEHGHRHEISHLDLFVFLNPRAA